MRQILFFDFEGTGVDPYHDRIVEFCFIADGSAWTERVNPGMPIPPDATEIHGISDADVAGCPPFAHFAPRIQDLVRGVVLSGYSSRRYDTVLLHAEMIRADMQGLETDSVGRIIQPEIDLLELWMRHEDRKLVTAAMRFGGRDLTDAHSADADALVLPDILSGMCSQFGIGPDIDNLCRLSVPDGAIDRDGKFVKNGVVVFNFGPKKGEPADSDIGLLRWMRSKDFSPETKEIALAIERHATRRSA